MGVLDGAYRFGVALFMLFLQLIALPLLLFSWAFSLIVNCRFLVLLLGTAVAMYFVVRYSNVVVDNGLYGMNTIAAPFYEASIRPIFDIIRTFFNRVICWFDAVLWFPYGYGRLVLFPILRDGGFGTAVWNFVRFFQQWTLDITFNYFMTFRFMRETADFSRICVKWQEFWASWQALVCYGCNDLCPMFTKLPIIPMIFTSDQWASQELWDAWTDFFNGWMLFFQEIYTLIQAFLFTNSKRELYRPNFRGSFDLWVRSTEKFWRSWEIAMNVFFVEFIPIDFVWDDLFGLPVVMMTQALRSLDLLINIGFHSDMVLTHFAGTDSTYWVNNIKEDYKEIIGLFGIATNFDPIPLTPQLIVGGPQTTGEESTISNYLMNPYDEAKPNAMPNPLFGKKISSQYACIMLTRIMCDPTNQGITCAQQFQDSLLRDVDICCPLDTIFGTMTDALAFVFEFTLHLSDARDFMRFANQQTFTFQLKERLVGFLTCAYQFFRVVETYGYCIERVLVELSNFMFCSVELLFRTLIGILTLPYYYGFMPGECNFISCGGGESNVAMAISFLERIGDTESPNGMLNCLSYLMNTGFMVPFAGCNNATCIPTGFVTPTIPTKKKRDFFEDSFYNRTAPRGYYRDILTPIMTYGGAPRNIMQSTGDWNKVKDASGVLLGAMTLMGKQFDTVFARWSQQTCSPGPAAQERGPPGCGQHPDIHYQRIMQTDNYPWNPFASEYRMINPRTLISANITVNAVNCETPTEVAPCFDLSCLPKSLVSIGTHTITLIVRSLNEFIQTRTAAGSGYFDGTDCMLGDPCLESDLIMEVVKLIQPLKCMCEFVKLLIPNVGGYSDPCCAFTVLGELVSCVIQIMINVINSINGDAPNYRYITDKTMLQKDFDVILSLSLQLFDCACSFVNQIFSVAFGATGQADLAKSFDPCCFLRVVVKAGLAAARVLFRIVLSFATLEQPESQCYLYIQTADTPERQACPIGVGQLQVSKDFALITSALFQAPAESSMRTCGVLRPGETSNDFGAGTCYCKSVNALLTMVFKFVTLGGGMNPVEHMGSINATTPNTCIIDLCCPIYRVSTIFQNAADFSFQFIWTFMQNWKDRRISILGRTEDFFLPQETFEFFFCDEYGPDDYFAGDRTINTAFLEQAGEYADMSYIFELENTYPTVPGGATAPNYRPSGESTPGLLQNAPLTGVGTYGSTIGVINSALGDPANQNNVTKARLKCGRLEPVIIGIYNLMARCLCIGGCQSGQSMPKPMGPEFGNGNPGLGNIADSILRYMLAFISENSPIFPFQIIWPYCLCCGGPKEDRVGMIIPFASAVTSGIRQIAILARNIPNPSYWTGAGVSFASGSNTPNDPNPKSSSAISNLADNLEDIKKTWISRFLAPFLDASCRFVTNSACILSLLLGETCSEDRIWNIRYRLISSIWAYGGQALIRAIALIEAAIKLFTQELPGQCVGNPNATNANANDPMLQGSAGAGGIPTCSQTAGYQNAPDYAGRKFDPNSMGRILVAMLTFIFDALIGIGKLGCTEVCPGLQHTSTLLNLNPAGSTCNCYNKSPYLGVSNSVCGFQKCQKMFNYGGMGPFTCLAGGNPSKCSAANALVMHTGKSDPTGIGLNIVNYLDYAKTYNTCSGGCDNDTMVVPTNGEARSGAGFTWEGKYPKWAPVLEPPTSTGQLACKVDTTDQNIIDEAKKLYGESKFVQTIRDGFWTYGPPSNNIYGVERGVPTFPPIMPTQPLACHCIYAGTLDTTIIPGYPAPLQSCNSISQSQIPLAPVSTSPGIPYYADPQRPPCPAAFDNGGAYYSNLASKGKAYANSTCIACLNWRLLPELDACKPQCTTTGNGFISYTGAGPGTPLCVECLQTYYATRAGAPTAPNIQKPCERALCVSKGWCKNDQNVPCARGYGLPVLDGVIMTALKYVRCLMTRLFGTNAGGPSTPQKVIGQILVGIMDLVMYILSIIWQLSGGIIRFLVAVAMFGMRMLQVSVSFNLFNAVDLAIEFGNLFVQFGAIFDQPVVLDLGPGVDKRRYGTYNNFESQLYQLLYYPDAHECINTANPKDCFCSTVACRENVTDLRHSIRVMSDIFDTDTECSMVWNHLDNSKVSDWMNVSYSMRYAASVCLTKHSRGQSWKKVMPSMPDNFFYNPQGPIKWVSNLMQTARQNQETRKRFESPPKPSRTFEKRFNMTHTQYLEKLNARFKRTKAHYIKDLGIHPFSPIMDTVLWMDSYHFRYRSGYWGHLASRTMEIIQNGEYINHDISIENEFRELRDAIEEISNGIHMSKTHVHQAWNFMTEQKNWYRDNPIIKVEWPWKFSHPTRNITYREYIREAMPAIHVPTHLWGPALRTRLPDRLLPQVRWNPIVERNWERAQRLFWSIVHVLWPEKTPKHIHERFIIGGDCRAYDGFVELGSKVINYCIADFTPNLNDTVSRKMVVIPRNKTTKALRTTMDRRTYRRTMIQTAQNWNFYDQVIAWIEDIFDVSLRSSGDEFFESWKAWFQNTNTKPSDYPDVGFLYWITFEYRCEFPENLNCSIGIGLTAALWEVGKYYLLIYGVLILTFPGLMSIVGFFLGFTGYIIAVAAAAWHYSFGCTIMFPSTAVSQLAVTLPILPFPVNVFPALPFCMWDEILGVTDAIFRSTYSWIPSSLFNGDNTGFINCKEVGISDGIQNLLFLGYFYLGNWFVELVYGITSTTLLRWIPGADTYMRSLITSFRQASETQKDRQLFCAWFTLPAIALPIFFIWIATSLLLVFVPAIIGIIGAFFALIPTLPFYNSIMGNPPNQMDGEDEVPTESGDSESEDSSEPPETINSHNGWSDYFAAKLNRHFSSKEKTL